MNRDNQEMTKKALAILAVIILGVLVWHFVSVISFNHKQHTVKGPDESQETYMDLHNRADKTSKWLKRDFDLNGKTVDLSAQTFDSTLYNRSVDDISEWKMTIRIQGDCFINNAWCGTVEIHQNVGTDREKVQTLDLRNCDRKDVELEYLYDGDLLIPLSKGDYIVYYPSKKDNEYPIKAHSELTSGEIFYYLNDIDVSDYQISYHYHRDYTEGIGFYIVIFLLIIWVFLFSGLTVAAISYKRAWKEMELRKSGISYMSDIYKDILIVDIDDDDLIPLHVSENVGRLLTKQGGAKEKLSELIRMDVTGPYLELMQEFVDLDTIDERLDRTSIACEFISASFGWCQARFFTMERKENQPLEKVIFTVQIIHEEKLEMDRIAESITRGEDSVKLAQNEEEYAVEDLTHDLTELAEEIAAENDLQFEKDMSASLPDRLFGDWRKMRRSTRYLLENTAYHMKGGTLRLAVYEKDLGEKAHLLISVKGTGTGMGLDDMDPGFDLVNVLLEPLGSELHIITEQGASSEMYFEVEQAIVAQNKSGGK